MSSYLIQLHLSKRKFFTDVLKGLLLKPNPDPGPRPSKTWTRTLDPQKTWTLKNLDPYVL